MAAINAVLSDSQRAAVRDLVAAETGTRRVSALQMLSWMRVHMPIAADRISEKLHPLLRALGAR